MSEGSFGFWTDNNLYLKKKNIFTVEFQFDIDINFSPALEGQELEDFQKHKEIVQKVNGVPIFLKSVKLPQFTLGSEKLRNPAGGEQMIVKPELLDWEPIRLTMVDPHFQERDAGTESGDPNSFRSPLEGIQLAIYYALGGPRGSNIQNATQAWVWEVMTYVLGPIIITTRNEFGDPLDEWVLWDCWITGTESSELAYADDSALEFSLMLDYKCAQYISYDAAGMKKVNVFKPT